jgi:hypothetical protein
LLRAVVDAAAVDERVDELEDGPLVGRWQLLDLLKPLPDTCLLGRDLLL